jgi:hypothetical protein
LVWRGAGAWSHAPGRSTAGTPHESDKSHESHEPDKPDKESGTDESYYDDSYYDDANDHPGPYQHGDADHECSDSDSERHAVTAARHRCRDC